MFIIHNSSGKITFPRAPARDYHDILQWRAGSHAEAQSNFKNIRKEPFPTVTLTIYKFHACMSSYPKFRLFLISLCQVQR